LETSSLDMIFLLLTFKIHWSKYDIIHIVIVTSMMSIIWCRRLFTSHAWHFNRTQRWNFAQFLCFKSNFATAKSEEFKKSIHFNFSFNAKSLDSFAEEEKPIGKNPKPPETAVLCQESAANTTPHPVSISVFVSPKSQNVAANLQVRKTPTESNLRALFKTSRHVDKKHLPLLAFS
jgi:hypothetical protein